MAKKKSTRRAPARGKKKTSRKKASSRRKAPAMEMLVVGSKTKAALKAHKVNVASDAMEGLNMIVHWYIEQAAKRASSNNRKTVRSHDFIIM